MLATQKLEIFVKIVETGSLRKAGEQLLLSQAAVSQHLRDLETQLGTRLFERSARGARLTASGQTLAEYAQRILLLVHEAEQATQAAAQAQVSPLALGATPGVSNFLLPRWLQQLYARCPRPRVVVSSGLTPQIVADVLAGELHFGVVEGEIELSPLLASEVLEDVAQWVVVGKSHPWWGQTALPLQALHQQAQVARPAHSQTSIWLQSLLNAHAVSPRVVLTLDSPEAIKQAVLNGMGFAILPEYVIRAELESGQLQALAVSDVLLRRALRLLWLANREWRQIDWAIWQVLSENYPHLAQLRTEARPWASYPPADAA